jgi:starch synthase
MIGRLDPQKGFDLLADAAPRLLAGGARLAVQGSGDPAIAATLRALATERPDRVALVERFDRAMARRIYAGADFFLMPSRFEPCGLNQLYSLRYGTLPVVRATGGLVDTVIPYDESSGTGTGFVFHDLTPNALYNVVGWATSTWYDRPKHISTMQKEAMQKDFSWDRSAAEYETLYRAAVARRRGPVTPG